MHLPFFRTSARGAIALLVLAVGILSTAGAAPLRQNVLQPKLPDVLTTLDGRKVTTAEQWNQQRRPELKRLFEDKMYGPIPPRPEKVDYATKVLDSAFLNGRATLKNVTISIPGHARPRIDLLLITPNKVERAPVFLTLNFCGNHAVHPDPRIPLGQGWLRDTCKGCTNNQATDAARGTQAKDWPIEQIIERGYALATFCNADVDSDRAEVSDGVYAWLATVRTGAAANSLTRDRGCISGWAWGFHRCVDYLMTEPAVDSKRVVALGHSRNGKTALLAAAFDERIAMAIPHQAGCGGTAPSRIAPELAKPQANGRPVAETTAVINRNFPHWFNAEFKRYNNNPDALPFDQNGLVALMAPRPVLFSNAEGDRWADPVGQLHVLKAAEPAYRLLGAGGCDAESMPELGRLVLSKLGYFIRSGTHSMIAEDWNAFLDYADKQLGSPSGEGTKLFREK